MLDETHGEKNGVADFDLMNEKGWLLERPDPSEPPLPLARLILENGISGMALIDEEACILYANREMAAMAGSSIQEILGKDIRDFFLKEENRDPLAPPTEWEGRGNRWEALLSGRGGVPRMTEVSVMTLKSERGKRYRVIGAVDISEHKRMGIELAESERKYRLLVENIEEFFFEQSIEGGFVFFNEAMVRHSGFSREELRVMNFKDYIVPEDWDRVEEFYAGILETGEPASGLLIRGRMKDGSLHYFAVRSNLKTDETGRKVGFRSYCRDVTAEILYEREQQKREEQLKAIVAGSPIPTIVMDKAHAIVHWNKACEELTGVRHAEMKGAEPFSSAYLKQPILSDFLIDGVSLKEISTFYRSECRQSEVVKDAYEVEAYFPDLGGGGKWLFLTAVFLRDSEGLITGAIETLLDITAKKRAETDMRKMQEALEAKVMERTRELQDINTALEVLLKKRENDKKSLEDRVTFSIKEVIAPHIELLKRTHLDPQQAIHIEMLEQNFLEICSPFMQILSETIRKLTPSEIQIVNLIKQNKSSKQIAGFLGVSQRTVEFHRDNIRKKLGIKKKKQNLRIYLLSER